MERTGEPTEEGDHSGGSQRRSSGAAAAAASKNLPKKKPTQDVPATVAEEETDEVYRRRVYGTSDTAAHGPARRDRSAAVLISVAEGVTSTRASMRRASRRFSRQLSRRRSSVVESLPDTPQGWVALVTTAASAVLAYELRLQKTLTSPPQVFCQDTPYNARLRHMLSTPAETGILSRKIKPSLLVGTRGRLASLAAYARPHRNDDDKTKETHVNDEQESEHAGADSSNTKLRFREIMTMGSDGAEIAVDWEVPPERPTATHAPYKSSQQRRAEILHGPIARPVVVILHGINNDASFGYIRSLMRACTDRGWVAAGFNFRGCGGVPLRTPRGYTGAYTGDLRATIHAVASRMVDDAVPLFVVGNSLGANLITKYLGEEGRAGTLPPNVAGGISLGNPLQIHSHNMHFPWAELLGMGVKKMILMHWRAFRGATSLDHRAAIRKALLSRTIGQLDCALAPHMIRNNPEYPFEVRVGYEDGEAYWDDASSHKYVQFVSVPLLKVTAQDDFLVYNSSMRKMSHCLENPNVLVVRTKCGGHLGWQEAPPDTGNAFGFGTSWADMATTEFIDAVINIRQQEKAAVGDKTKEDYLADVQEEGSRIRPRL